MIGVSVSASRASVRRAQRAVRRAESSAARAEFKALKLGADNVRKMEIGLIKGNKSKALGLKVAPLDKPWRRLLHPDRKMGAAFTEKYLWPARPVGPHGREIDIVPGLQPYLDRWEHGGGTRPAQLRGLVSNLQGTPQGRRYYYAKYKRRPGWPADPLALPPVVPQPQRNVRALVTPYANRHMPEWYESIYRKMIRRA